MADMWENDQTRDYLGDGVYVAFDGYSFWLRINDHRNEASEICLEPQVLDHLDRFRKAMEALVIQKRNQGGESNEKDSGT